MDLGLWTFRFRLWTLLLSPNGAAGCSRGWSGAAALRPVAQPVESGTQENRFFFILFSPRRGEGGARTNEEVHRGASRTSLIRFACRHFLRPIRGGCVVTHLLHGLRVARLQRATLHPRLHAVAPLGLIRIRSTAGQGRPCRRPAPPRRAGQSAFLGAQSIPRRCRGLPFWTPSFRPQKKK